jgi:3-oxoadipate enol-lactonase/4-carboxymuconolactone decarboxylase
VTSPLPDHRIDGPAGAPVLVLGSSLGTTADVWRPQLPALTARFRVVTTDLPGHAGGAHDGHRLTIDDLGRSLLALLDHLDVERASLAGISLGGMVSMWVAANAPERVDRLVLCCTAAHLPPAESWAERAALARTDGAMSLLPRLLDRWFTADAPGAHRELVTGMLSTVDDEGYAACCEAVGAMDLRADLARITAPTLVIGGALDPVCPAPATLELHTGIAGSELMIVPRAAHLANVEQAERVTTAIVHHLAGLPAERGMAVRREVLGDAHVDRAVTSTSPFTAPFQDLAARWAWGEVWTRPGLDRRTRSCITLAMLVALGRFEELAMHVRGARRNGLSPDEIGEVLLQTAVYCGVPAANQAFAEAARVLREENGTDA